MLSLWKCKPNERGTKLAVAKKGIKLAQLLDEWRKEGKATIIRIYKWKNLAMDKKGQRTVMEGEWKITPFANNH